MITSITLKSTQVEDIAFRPFENAARGMEPNLSFGVGYNESEPSSFLVSFEVILQIPEGYSLEVTYIAAFETDKPIDETFRESPFPIVNAPAIAYPYLRSFISNLTLSAGYAPVILPTINFQALANKRRQSARS